MSDTVALRLARMAYRSALDPTATCLGYPSEVQSAAAAAAACGCKY